MQLILADRIESLSGSKKNIRVMDWNTSDFRTYWQSFLKTYPFHNFDYTLQSLDYRQLLMGTRAQNISFILINNENRPLAICPLFIVEGSDKQKRGAFGFSKAAPVPLFYPHLSEKQRRSLEDIVFEEATQRLEKHDTSIWMIEADVLSVGTELIEDQFPARYKALDISIHQHIIDLTLDESEIWSQIRRRSHAQINQGLKLYDFKVYDRDNYTDDIGEKHRLLHHKTSGRMTRPLETFALMYSWIRDGQAFMVEQIYQDKTVNMTLVEVGKLMATVASTADDPDFTPPAPLMHSMMWVIIQECKKRHFKYFNAGETNFRDTPFQLLSQKEKNIIHFKRGFGDRSWPLKKWIWFKDALAELQFLKNCLQKYETHLTQTDEII